MIQLDDLHTRCFQVSGNGGIPNKIDGFPSDSFENRYFGVVTILGYIHKGHIGVLCSPAFTVLTTSFPSAFGDQSAGTSPETNSN